ncbi:CASP8-associated protein 2 [Pelobates fuscus]|uniref:CASP8-associated protein 2 n=1 Tax=Pelobates fuscus TaxID=191477 RepID=UPI002FE4543D
MAEKCNTNEDLDMISFFDVCSSPAKSEASSLDIYDGLDTTFSGELPESSTPSRDCLDLYEEIITEEVAAKEASFNDLQSEYEKCQKKMKILIRKFKEIQLQNTNLQNENQCLKKNISALIKTARVEITRKQEEIDQLTQSLLASSRIRGGYPIPALIKSSHVMKSKVDTRCRDLRTKNVENVVRTEVKDQVHSSEGTMCTNASNISEKETCDTSSRDSRAKNVDSTVRTAFKVQGHSPESKKYRNFTKCTSESAKNVESVIRTDISIQDINSEGNICGYSSKNTSEKETMEAIITGSRSTHLESFITEVKAQSSSSESNIYNNIKKNILEKDKLSDSAESSMQSTPKCSNIKLHMESLESPLQKLMSECHQDAKDKKTRKEKDTDYRVKDNDQRRRKEERQYTNSTLANKNRSFDLRDKLQEWSSNRGKSEGGQESRNTKSDMNYDISTRKCFTSSSCDKPGTSRERKHFRDESHQRERHKNTCENSERKRESRNKRDRDTDYRKRSEETEDNLLRRSKRTPVSYSNDEKSSNSHCDFNDQRNSDPAGKEKHLFQYNNEIKSSYNKESNSGVHNKNEMITPKNKNIRENKSTKHDRDKRGDEKKRSQQDRDLGKNESKEYKENNDKEKITTQSPNKRHHTNIYVTEQPSISGSRSTIHIEKESLGDKQPNTKKDLKLSFMETLNLTLSPAKKNSQCEVDTTLPDIKCNTSVSKVIIESSLDICLGSTEEPNSKPHLGSTLNAVSKTDVELQHLNSSRDAVSKTSLLKPHSDVSRDGSKTNAPKEHLGSAREAVSKTDAPKERLDSSGDVVSKTDAPKEHLDSPGDAVSKTDAPKEHLDSPGDAVSKTDAPKEHLDCPGDVVSNMDTPKEHLDSPIYPDLKMDVQSTTEEMKVDFKLKETASCDSESIADQPENNGKIMQTQVLEGALQTTVAGTNATPTKISQTYLIREADDVCSLSPQEVENGSFVDLVELGSFIEIDKCSGSDSPLPSNTSKDVIIDLCQEEDSSDDADNNTNNSKSSVNERSKGIYKSSNIDLIDVNKQGAEYKSDEESSIMSIDLNVLRNIPKVISPLTSPEKPLGKLHKVKGTATASIVRVLKKEYSPDTNTSIVCASLSKELNKENCQPESKMDTACGKYSPIQISSDEVEEGEIISDEEESLKTEEKEMPPDRTSPKQTIIAEKVKQSPTPAVCKRDVAPSFNHNRIVTPERKNASKTKEKTKTRNKTKLIPLPENMRKKLNDSCLEGVVNIVQPSNVQDVLQMLHAVRMHMRVKYMKFKIQVSFRQFHRVIENGCLYFITLIKSLDWSPICSTPDNVKKSLCKCIESKFNQIKENMTVDHIFEQHLIDMKKKLWIFVDEQLDSLFDTLTAMLTKHCDKATPECNGDDSKVSTKSSANKKKSPVHAKSHQKASPKTAHARLFKKIFGSESCLRLGKPEKKSETNITSNKQLIVPTKKLTSPKAVRKDPPLSDIRNGAAHLNTVNPKFSRDSHLKDPVSTEDQSQNNSSGLSFNLVSDDHMGDLFKTLLDNLDQVEETKVKNENLWECASPKKNLLAQKCEIVNVTIEETTPIKDYWHPPSLSSSILSRYNSLLHPDVLDESCMLEIPSSATSTKSIGSSDDRSKSFASVLLEDLAVSLTVPSPLKSDSHLSFLRAGIVPESVSGDIIANYSEDALLEEDASEQDIHLTLDSENSSSCSLPIADELSAFQYHPSEPMQAVIMEKSNDHFVVKIRRAVSADSPNSEGSSTEHTEYVVPHLEDSEVKDFENRSRNSDDVIVQGERSSNVQRSDRRSQGETGTDGSRIPKAAKDILEKKEAKSFKLQFPIDSSTPEQTSQGLKSLKDLRPNCETLVPTDINESCHGGKSSTECTKGVAMTPDKLEADHLFGTDLFPLTIAEERDSGLIKKRKTTLKVESFAKRPKVSSVLGSQLERKKSKQSSKNSGKKVSTVEKSGTKHKKSSRDGAIQRSSKCSTKNLSAKNVIKKKGEVVVSWTREEDRAILVECQKHGPNAKTFLSLSITMKKFPYQVEERFKQLLKLFKKSKHPKS